MLVSDSIISPNCEICSVPDLLIIFSDESKAQCHLIIRNTMLSWWLCLIASSEERGPGADGWQGGVRAVQAELCVLPQVVCALQVFWSLTMNFLQQHCLKDIVGAG